MQRSATQRHCVSPLLHYIDVFNEGSAGRRSFPAVRSGLRWKLNRGAGSEEHGWEVSDRRNRNGAERELRSNGIAGPRTMIEFEEEVGRKEGRKEGKRKE